PARAPDWTIRPAIASFSTAGTRPMSRAEASGAYEALPLPDTSEEHWRFTDLAGFDPEGFAGAASAEIETLLELDVAGYATVNADGIDNAPGPAADTSSYSNAVTELFVEPGAKLEYVSLQNLSTETWHFASHHARVERDAELDWVAGGFGSKKGKTRIQNDLNGRGATSRVTGA